MYLLKKLNWVSPPQFGAQRGQMLKSLPRLFYSFFRHCCSFFVNLMMMLKLNLAFLHKHFFVVMLQKALEYNLAWRATFLHRFPFRSIEPQFKLPTELISYWLKSMCKILLDKMQISDFFGSVIIHHPANDRLD